MNNKLVAGLTLLCATVPATIYAQQFEVTGSSNSSVTDLFANPNTVTDIHSFDNTSASSVITPTTTNSSAAMAFGSTSGSITSSEGIFQGISTAIYN
jgi:hypothetical protein